jgi:maltose O-acetyltransferase
MASYLHSRLRGLKRRSLARLRGRIDLERLVALGLQLGDGAFVAEDAYLDPGHPWLISIGEAATLGPGVVVMAHDASMRRQTGHTLIAPVRIGVRAFIGARAIVLPGTTIGDESVVGAGAVVRGQFPPKAVITGNPGRVVADVDSFVQRHRDALANAPAWPHEGWVIGSGITEDRKRTQREALATATVGYLVGSEVTAPPTPAEPLST